MDAETEFVGMGGAQGQRPAQPGVYGGADAGQDPPRRGQGGSGESLRDRDYDNPRYGGTPYR